jgi:DNA adenine methylase
MPWTAAADKPLVPAEISPSPASSPLIGPLLKWAGGKRQLLPTLRQHYPASFDRYVEPFVGSGAVFFDLYSAGRLQGRRARLVDVNVDLIGCYRAVRDDVEAVIAALEALEDEHRRRGTACYYDVRDRRFNPARLGRTPSRSSSPARTSDNAIGGESAYPPELAAMVIYLNRTGFNGLFRVNRQGGFNVPAGRYTNPKICDAARLRAVARAFSADGVTLDCLSFAEVLAETRTGDFVYCDPPYAPISRTANFGQYTAGGFTAGDQETLRQAVIAAGRRGTHVVLSNSSAPEIESAYRSPAANAAGLAVHRVAARRSINARASARGPVDELIVTNVAAPAPVLPKAKNRILKMHTVGRRKTG